MERAYELARFPFVASDYTVTDEEGHRVEHLLIEGFIFAFWIDHAVRRVLITEIEAAG